MQQYMYVYLNLIYVEIVCVARSLCVQEPVYVCVHVYLCENI